MPSTQEPVLPGVAAGGAALVDRGETDLGEPALLSVNRVGRVNLDTQVVERGSFGLVELAQRLCELAS